MGSSIRGHAPTADRLGPGRRMSVRGLLLTGVVLPLVLLTSVLTDALGMTAGHRVGAPDDPAPSAEALAGAARPGEAVHVTAAVAVLGVILVAAVIVLLRPGRPAPARYLLAASGALLPVALVMGDPDNHGGQAGPVDLVFLVLPLPAVLAALIARPWVGTGRGRAPRLAVRTLATVAVVPAAWWGVGQALVQRNTFPPAADPHHNSHWYVMAVLAFMVVLMSVAGLAREGWRLPAATAALVAAAVGVVSLWDPRSASALGTPWAIAVVAWSLGMGGLVLGDGARRRRPSISHDERISS